MPHQKPMVSKNMPLKNRTSSKLKSIDQVKFFFMFTYSLNDRYASVEPSKKAISSTGCVYILEKIVNKQLLHKYFFFTFTGTKVPILPTTPTPRCRKWNAYWK